MSRSTYYWGLSLASNRVHTQQNNQKHYSLGLSYSLCKLMSKITRFGAQKHTEMNTGNLRRKKIKLGDDNRISAFPSTEEALVKFHCCCRLHFCLE